MSLQPTKASTPAMQCSEEAEKIFRSRHQLFESTEISGDALDALETFNNFSHLNVKKRSVSRLESIDLFRPEQDEPFPDSYGVIVESSRLKRILQALVELIGMYTVERWKLKEPLVYNFYFGLEGWYDYGRNL